mmetsp:Transcript_17927/g.39571  ORF Transcript_17927/g.39571 Transcript_17927/m.39571 type:complete len:213 (-) Transcript_17927:259-897(-)
MQCRIECAQRDYQCQLSCFADGPALQWYQPKFTVSNVQCLAVGIVEPRSFGSLRPVTPLLVEGEIRHVHSDSLVSARDSIAGIAEFSNRSQQSENTVNCQEHGILRVSHHQSFVDVVADPSRKKTKPRILVVLLPQKCRHVTERHWLHSPRVSSRMLQDHVIDEHHLVQLAVVAEHKLALRKQRSVSYGVCDGVDALHQTTLDVQSVCHHLP